MWSDDVHTSQPFLLAITHNIYSDTVMKTWVMNDVFEDDSNSMSKLKQHIHPGPK
jgi:hypothetical protein